MAVLPPVIPVGAAPDFADAVAVHSEGLDNLAITAVDHGRGAGSGRQLFVAEMPANEKPRWRNGVFPGKTGQRGNPIKWVHYRHQRLFPAFLDDYAGVMFRDINHPSHSCEEPNNRGQLR